MVSHNMQQRETRSIINDSSVQLSRASEENSPQAYKVLNISRGGLCFQSSEAFELNEKVKLNVTVKDQSILIANGRVCYHNETDDKNTSHYGLSFLDHFIDADFIRQQK